jgi:hypothetical protein
MKIANPYKCDGDGCGRMKEATNHWLIGIAGPKLITIHQWTDGAPDAENAVHLCGIECAQKWLNRSLAKQVGQ